MSVLVAIQARMSSTRLPGKVLADLGGKPMLQRVWEACSGFQRVVLTSKDPTDDPLVHWLVGMGYPYRRGSLADVLSRYAAVAREKNPNVLVRVCGDAPFLERRWIWKAVDAVEKFDEPVFVPQALHAGTTEHWLRCAEETDDDDREHAGAFWFELHGRKLELVPDSYLMVNTHEELLEARKRVLK